MVKISDAEITESIVRNYRRNHGTGGETRCPIDGAEIIYAGIIVRMSKPGYCPECMFTTYKSLTSEELEAARSRWERPIRTPSYI